MSSRYLCLFACKNCNILKKKKCSFSVKKKSQLSSFQRALLSRKKNQAEMKESANFFHMFFLPFLMCVDVKIWDWNQSESDCTKNLICFFSSSEMSSRCVCILKRRTLQIYGGSRLENWIKGDKKAELKISESK